MLGLEGLKDCVEDIYVCIGMVRRYFGFACGLLGLKKFDNTDFDTAGHLYLG